MTDYFIRLARPEDAPFIIEAHIASIRELGPSMYPADVLEGWAYRRNPEDLRQKILSGLHFMSVAVEEGGMILGFSNYTFDTATQTHRIGLYVRGVSARKGVGRSLFQVAEKYAYQAGANEVHSSSSLIAEPFYKEMGYIAFDKAEHLFKNGAAIEIVNMKKILRPS
jgi:GNAT superfamily N-acetyltransferase